MKNDDSNHDDDLKSAFRAMKTDADDTSGELDLKSAFRAVKDEFDGTSPDADLTLHRALFASRLQTRRRKVVRWSLIPIAAALFASTAWAGATGRLAPVVETVREVFHAESAPAEPAPSPALGYARAIPKTSDDAGPTELAQNAADAAAATEESLAQNEADAGLVTPDNGAGAPALPAANAGPANNTDSSGRTGATSLGPTADNRAGAGAGATLLGPSANDRAGAGATAANANAPSLGATANSGNRAGAGATSLSANANAGNRAGAGATSLGVTAHQGNRAGAGASSAAPSASAPARASAVAANEPPPPPAAPPAARPVAEDPNAQLFADAHRIHFIERDPARALGAWDRYLASAPNGSLAPEARYNRALALIRLNRTAEARTELEKFANGNYSGYRRTEARALLDALARDAGP